MAPPDVRVLDEFKFEAWTPVFDLPVGAPGSHPLPVQVVQQPPSRTHCICKPPSSTTCLCICKWSNTTIPIKDDAVVVAYIRLSHCPQHLDDIQAMGRAELPAEAAVHVQELVEVRAA